MSRLDSRQVEQLVDDALHSLCVAVDCPREFGPLFCGNLRILQRFSEPTNDSQRRAQLVRDVGDEVSADRLEFSYWRQIEERDYGAARESTVVVNEALVRRLFPGEDPVGRKMLFGPDRSPAAWTIVGNTSIFGPQLTPSVNCWVGNSLATKGGLIGTAPVDSTGGFALVPVGAVPAPDATKAVVCQSTNLGVGVFGVSIQ